MSKSDVPQSLKLFEVPKIGVMLERITHETEMRRGENRVKIAVLHLRVYPFDKKLAAAMSDGVARRLFTQNGDADPMTLSLGFTALVDRQILKVYAAPDTTEGTTALDQVRIYGVKASRTPTENAFVLSLKASFGPLSSRDWEFIEAWRSTQRFVSFASAQPNLDFLPQEEEADDEDEAAEPGLPLANEGTCAHGSRIGEACDDCPDSLAAAPSRVVQHKPRKPAAKRK